ncbi:MAG: M23 family metallopeptidase [Spirochaetaceae bacterium]|nr:M23 family metallopeptidase [Spirochaetaceae bacterium]
MEYCLLQKIRKFSLWFVFFSVCTNFICGTTTIQKLSHRDLRFKEFLLEIEKNYQKIAQNATDIQLKLYYYTATEDDTLLSLAARCTLPYETLATLNRISSPDASLANKTIILPTFPGIFLVNKPKSPLEIILYKKYFSTDLPICYTKNSINYYFLLNTRLEPTERTFFLDVSMKIPLADAVISSEYGPRISPISGVKKFHSGVDFSAPLGTSVFACKGGIVEEVGYNSVYGNFIILKHDNNTFSFYAHLDKILVKKNQMVYSNFVIGLVGSTGASTGPHLHFEVWQGGEKLNPLKMVAY